MSTEKKASAKILLGHERNDSGHGEVDPKNAPRTPSPVQKSGLSGSSVPDPGEKPDKVENNDLDPPQCTMVINKKKCESEGREFVPYNYDYKIHIFCEPCVALPRIALIDRAEGVESLLEAIYRIHADEALRLPICLGSDFGNTLKIPDPTEWQKLFTEAIWENIINKKVWHNILLEERLRKWRKDSTNPEDHRCMPVGLNYTICDNCTMLLREHVDKEKFDNTFHLQNDVAALRLPCALQAHARSLPTKWYSWIDEGLKERLLEDIKGDHDTVAVPGAVCRQCVDVVKNQPGFLDDYDRAGNPKDNRYARIRNTASSIPTVVRWVLPI